MAPFQQRAASAHTGITSLSTTLALVMPISNHHRDERPGESCAVGIAQGTHGQRAIVYHRCHHCHQQQRSEDLAGETLSAQHLPTVWSCLLFFHVSGRLTATHVFYFLLGSCPVSYLHKVHPRLFHPAPFRLFNC